MNPTVVAQKHRKKTLASACIYLDHAATTSAHPRVVEAIYSVLSDHTLGNPHAKHHLHGNAAHDLIEVARTRVAKCIDAQPQEIIFTSGATESNNLAIKGLISYLQSRGKTHIITTAVEHKSLLEPILGLQEYGFSISVLPVKPCGMIEASMLAPALRTNTGLVSVQAVNNETGTIQPLSEISQLLKERDIIFHSDAAQALGKMPFSVMDSGVDLASFSAHKIQGPQGIGALFVSRRKNEMLKPLHSGGGQEMGLRSGTLPVALCVGFGTSCELIQDHRSYLERLRQIFIERIGDLKPIIHGHRDKNWNVPGILNLRFPGIDSETLVMELPGLAFGIGAACNSSGAKFSHVIKAITGSEQAARESIRISFGHLITEEELCEAAEQLCAAVKSIRQLQE